MEDKIKAAFDQIHADPKIVRRCKAALRKNSFDYGRERQRMKNCKIRRASCFAMLAAVLLGAGIYRLPTASIDIDINPSVELKINAFDKVVKAKGLNDDGRAVIEQLELENLRYTKAVRKLLLSESMEPYMDGEQVLSITVVGGTLENEEEFLRNVVCSASVVTKEENLCYFKADADTAQAAKKAGLSVARYRALLELQAENPNITADDVLKMSMQEIKELIGCDKIDQPCGYGLQENN